MKRLFALFKKKFSPVLEGRFWKLKVSLICVIYCILISMPNYNNFNASRLRKSNSYGVLVDNYKTINTQIDHPFRHNLAAEDTHASKLDFRFVPALLARAIPSHDLLTRMLGLYLMNNIAGVIFFMCILQLVFEYSGNRTYAALAALNFAVLYVGKSFFHDTLLWNDGIAFMFLTIALVNRNAVIVAACLLLAFFTDERSVFASLLLFVYRRLRPGAAGLTQRAVLYEALPFLAAGVLYLASRTLLQQAAGLHLPVGANSGVSLFLRFRKGFPVWLSLAGILLAYKSAWVIIGLSAWWLRKRPLDFTIYIFGLASMLLISVSVQDLTRSLAYAFTAMLTGFLLFHKEFSAAQKEKMEYQVFYYLHYQFMYPHHSDHIHS